MTRARRGLSVEFPWLVYTTALAALSAVDRLFPSEVALVDEVIDATINAVAFFGLIGSAVWSVVAARSSHPSQRVNRTVRLLVSGFLGPGLAFAVTTGVTRNVDGALWMIFLPGIGLGLVILGLTVVSVIDVGRRRRAD